MLALKRAVFVLYAREIRIPTHICIVVVVIAVRLVVRVDIINISIINYYYIDRTLN